jgi:glycosyltransferase involved in cell wall biosynthesis
MNIVFAITRADAVGGASVHVRDLSRALLDEGHQPTVLLAGTGVVSRQLEAAGVRCISLRHLRRSVDPVRDLLAVREMREVLRGLEPDLVSAHTAKAGFIARLACRGLGVPVLYTPHGWAIADRISRRQGAIYRVAERAVGPLATSIVNVCHYEYHLAMRHRIGADYQHLIIYNGMPDVPHSLRAHPELAPPRLAMVARFEAPKDHLTLIEALAGLQHMEWTLTLAGDGPLQPQVRRRVAALGLAARVEFAGSTENIAELLSDVQIFVLSSRSEAFPRSILEAMRAGLPVVASNVGGVAEAVEDGASGFVVEKQSPAAMREALACLIGEHRLRARLGAEGRRIYERRFTFRRMLSETLAAYERIIGQPALEPAYPVLERLRK